MQLDPQGVAPDDLSHAGSVVDKAIEYMIEQHIAPISVASALLGGALGLLARTMDDRAIGRGAAQCAGLGRIGRVAGDAGPAAGEQRAGLSFAQSG